MLWLCLHLQLDAQPESRADATLQGLAAWAWQYSDRVALVEREPGGANGCALLAEIEGSLRLFGGLALLRAQLLASFAQFGYPHSCAIAPTPAAAELLARCSEAEPALDLAALPARLAPLPLSALDLPGSTLAALHGVGLRTAGECLALPHDQVARRFGAATVKYLRRLIGDAPDPRPLFVLPPGWRRRCELQWAVNSFEPLGFVLKRLLLELEGVLVARDNAVLTLLLTLEHEESPASTLRLALGAPRRDAPALWPLLRERLERVPLSPVTALTLQVEEFAGSRGGQHDLFDDTVKREAAARELVERLVARLGEQAVQGIALREDHRPEKSSGPIAPFGAPLAAVSPQRGAGSDNGGAAVEAATYPFWLLREPRILREPPPRMGEAQRIETGWWDGKAAARDYYVAETAAGERLWVFRERGQWFLHGLWA